MMVMVLNIFTGLVLFDDGTWLSRYEYEGSESWEYNHPISKKQGWIIYGIGIVLTTALDFFFIWLFISTTYVCYGRCIRNHLAYRVVGIYVL